MKHALLLSSALAVVAGPALALQTPMPGKKDASIQYQNYDPDDVVKIEGVEQWSVMTVEYGADEVPINASPANSEILHVDPPHNNIHVWQFNGCLKNSPVFTFTRNLKTNEQRSYKFRVTTNPSNCDAVGQPAEPDPNTPSVGFQKVSHGDQVIKPVTPPLTLKFLYPADAKAAARERSEANRQKRDRGRAGTILQQQPEYRDPFNPQHRNVKFFGHGDEILEPNELWDDGFSSVFVYLGNRVIPTFWRTLPDGREAKVNCTVYGGNAVLCEGTSQIWRMRSGNTVWEEWNSGYTAAGQSPNTGTISPYVQRVIKGGGDDR